MKAIWPAIAAMFIGWAPTTASAEGWAAEQTYADTPKAVVWQAVIESLERNDIPVISFDLEHGEIRASQHNYLNSGWAACPNLNRRNVDPLAAANLRGRTSPLYRGVDLHLQVTETEAGTRLSLDPHYYNIGRDYGRRRFAIQVPCRTTGVLEQALFTAVSGK